MTLNHDIGIPIKKCWDFFLQTCNHINNCSMSSFFGVFGLEKLI